MTRAALLLFCMPVVVWAVTAWSAAAAELQKSFPGIEPIRVKTIPIRGVEQDDSTPGHDWRRKPTPADVSASFPPPVWSDLPVVKVKTLRCSPKGRLSDMSIGDIDWGKKTRPSEP